MAAQAKKGNPKTNPKTTLLDEIGKDLAVEAPDEAGLHITVTIENAGKDREDPPSNPPDPQVVKLPIREDHPSANLHLPTDLSLHSATGGRPKLTFTFTVSR